MMKTKAAVCAAALALVLCSCGNPLLNNLLGGKKKSGTPGDPWLIDSVAGLDAIRDDLSGSFKLTDNITIPTGNWTPIGDDTNQFTGTFDGNGQTITYNTVTINDGDTDSDPRGLFGSAGAGSEIKNLKLTGTLNVSVGNMVGGPGAGRVYGTIRNCVSSVTVIRSGGPDANSGGIAGYVYPGGTVTNCYSTGNVTAGPTSSSYLRAGGIAGGNGSGIISYCYAAGSVSVTANGAWAGGITSPSTTASGSVTNCVALNADVYASGTAYTVMNRIGLGGANNYGLAAMTQNGGAGSWTSSASGADGADVTLAATQAGQNWWQTTMGFTFGSPADETNPWKWNTTLQRPVLWFE